MSDEAAGYSTIGVAVSAVVGLVVAVGSVWAVNALAGETAFFETLFRVGPTVQDGGVGADWTTGNTIPALDFLIALIHAADVLLGVFILVLVFLHWASFRRLAGMMRAPSRGERTEGVATDGGERKRSEREPRRNAKRSDGGKRTDGPRASSNERRESDGGRRAEDDGVSTSEERRR